MHFRETSGELPRTNRRLVEIKAEEDEDKDKDAKAVDQDVRPQTGHFHSTSVVSFAASHNMKPRASNPSHPNRNSSLQWGMKARPPREEMDYSSGQMPKGPAARKMRHQLYICDRPCRKVLTPPGIGHGIDPHWPWTLEVTFMSSLASRRCQPPALCLHGCPLLCTTCTLRPMIDTTVLVSWSGQIGIFPQPL